MNFETAALLGRRSLLLTSMLAGLVAFAQPATSISGTVVEKVDAAGYSYVRVKTATADEWAAVPQVELATGAKVTIEVQARMQNFESKTLKRTWPVITFGTVAAPAAQPGLAGKPAPIENPHAAGLPKTLSIPPLDGTVLERIDAGVYTYVRLKTKAGETWAAVSRAELPVGMQVRIKNPQPMDGFQSPTLKRTFERIVFGSLELPAASPATTTK